MSYRSLLCVLEESHDCDHSVTHTVEVLTKICQFEPGSDLQLQFCLIESLKHDGVYDLIFPAAVSHLLNKNT